MSRIRTARRFFGISGLLLAAMVFAASAALASVQDESVQTEIEEIAQPSGREFLIQVNTIEVQVFRSDPIQVGVSVDGVIGDGCTRLDRIEQSRDGNAIAVRIMGYHTGDPICTMLAQLYRDNVGLEGTFEPGTYTVDVNGVVSEFRVE